MQSLSSTPSSLATLVPQAIAQLLRKGSAVKISYLGEFRRYASGVTALRSANSGETPESQGVKFLLSAHLKALLSAGPDSKAEKEFEEGLTSGTITFECARDLAAELSTTEAQAQSALGSWLSSLIAQLHSLKSGTRLAVQPLGFFQVRRYQQFAGVNPKTKEPIPLPPKVLMFFQPSIRLCCALSNQASPEEVSHEQFLATFGPIMSIPTTDGRSILELASQVPGRMPGISQAEIEELQSIAKVPFPTLLKQLLLQCSTSSPPLQGLCEVASSKDACASLVERYGDKENSPPSGLPFAEVSPASEAAWCICACPQVFAAQEVFESCHDDDPDALRLSGWIASRVLLHRALHDFRGRVLRYDDAVTLMNYLAPVESGEGLHPNVPV
jgi:nucleoid DNA-binding protein